MDGEKDLRECMLFACFDDNDDIHQKFNILNNYAENLKNTFVRIQTTWRTLPFYLKLENQQLSKKMDNVFYDKVI